MVPWGTAIVIISIYSIRRNLSSVKCLLCVNHILSSCIYEGYLMDPILRSCMDNCKAKISVPLPSPSVYQNPWGCRKSCLLAQFCQTNADHSSGILTNWNHLDALTEAKKTDFILLFPTEQPDHNTGPCGWPHPLAYTTFLEVKWLWNHWLALCIKQLICPGALTGCDEPSLWPRFSNSRQGKFDNCAINLPHVQSYVLEDLAYQALLCVKRLMCILLNDKLVYLNCAFQESHFYLFQVQGIWRIRAIK